MFKNLKELFEATYKTTAKKGIPALEKELFDCNAALNKHLNNLGRKMSNLIFSYH